MPRRERPRLFCVVKTKGTAQGRGAHPTEPTTRRAQQSRGKPSRPRKIGEGVAKAAQDEDEEPQAAGRQHERRRRRKAMEMDA